MKFFEESSKFDYSRSSIKPKGAYLISNTPEGGLIREGAYLRGGIFTKSNDKK